MPNGIDISLADFVAHDTNYESEQVNIKSFNNAIFEGISYATVGDDEEPPVTNLYFDTLTCEVTLIAIKYPLNSPCIIKATYYKIDSGNFEVYTSPFILPEGTHTVYFYSEDICYNMETLKSKTLTCDTTPPTVTITSPEKNSLYLFGNRIMSRIFGSNTLCIGRVPVAATADDNGGAGVKKVLFSYNGYSGWDDTAPYEDVFGGRVFGDLTISVTAIDNLGHESEPVEMTIKCYSLG